jgi:FRG domain
MGKPPPVSPSQLEGTISAPKIRVHEVAFSDPVEFLEALSPGGLFVGSHVYRGQADHTWSLAPSAFRDNIPYILSREFFPSKDRAYGTQVKLEIELLWLFVARADTAGLTIPGETERVREIIDSIRRDGWWVAEPKNLRKWPPRELIPALSLAQHHGIPTRLLDWTYDARVAIYFAAEGAARRADRSGRLAVWVCALKEDRISVVGAPSLEIARPSSAFNANLRAQRGCLMVWRKGARPEQLFNRHSMEEELSAEADRSGVRGLPIFYKLTLPQAESGSLLQLLSLQQIDGSTLFPGFDGVARVIRERIYWEGFEGTGGSCPESAIAKNRRQMDEEYSSISILLR